MLGFVAVLAAYRSSVETLTLERVTAVDILQKVVEHKGENAVVLNVWATWCAPCVEEFPMIVDLGRTYRDKGLAVYFVSVDWLDQATQVTAFLEMQGVGGLSFIKDEKDQPFIDAISREWTGAVPFTIVYGRQSGEVVDYWEGKAPREKFEIAVQAALVH
jgi:thiol-disulfide isomerase/thioredoxin